MTVDQTRPPHLHEILPALQRVQVDLGADLSTAALAAVAGMSPSRFHAVFRRETGETVKQHTLRLRLERAAFRLLTELTPVAAIAYDLGFGSHETFTRAFRRANGMAPSEFRTRMRPTSPLRVGSTGSSMELAAGSVSRTSAVHLQSAHLAFVRHVGPYDEVDRAAFDKLAAWTRTRRLQPLCLVGIAHDAPGITPDDRLRFDQAVQVSRPFRSTADVGHQVLPERWSAVTSYVGPFTGLAAAYEQAFAAAAGLRGFDVIGLPVEERYLTGTLLSQQQIHTTQILIPLKRTAR